MNRVFSFALWLDAFFKARGHKYIKRVPSGTTKTGRVRYRYIYKVGHTHRGKHVDHHDDMVEGSKFMIHSKTGEEVHLHITGVGKDGMLTLVYDDGAKKGQEETMSKDQFAQLLDKEHGVKEAKQKRESRKKPSPKKVEDALNVLLSALQDNPALLTDPRLKSLLGDVSVDEKTMKGKDAELYIKDAKGLKKVNARYKIVDASSLIASHNPNSFGKNEKYPKGVQERDYTGDYAEQNKVKMNAQNFIPALAVNTNPDATNGAPIVTPEGVVLGGNSRSMSMKLVYEHHPERAKELKAYLKEHAKVFGLSSKDVESVENPVLIREHDPEKDTKEHLQMLVRQLNVTLTQEMDTRTAGRAVSVLLSDTTIKKIADGLSRAENKEKTLSEFFGTPSDHVDTIIEMLRKDTIITDQNQRNWIEVKNGKKRLSSTAIQKMGDLFLGKVISDVDVLRTLPNSLANNLRSAVPLLVSKGVPKEMLSKLETAVQILSESINSGVVSAGGSRAKAMKEFQNFYMDQVEMDAEKTKLKDKVRKDPLINQFVSVMILANGAKKLKNTFKEIGNAYSPEDEGMMGLFGEPPKTPEKTLESEVQRHAKKENVKEYTFKSSNFAEWAEYFIKKMES